MPPSIVQEFIRYIYVHHPFSIRSLAVSTGYNANMIAKICKGLKNDLVSLRQTLDKKEKSKSYRALRDQARKIYQRHYGIILPRKQVVHHIDENPENNDINNLVVMSLEEHTRLHHPKQSDIPRHLQPKRQEYMKKYQAKYKQRQLWIPKRKN